MIVLAAIFILYSAVEKWMAGLQLENLGAGTVLVLAAGVLNAGLGWYLIRMGRRTRSLRRHRLQRGRLGRGAVFRGQRPGDCSGL